MIKRTKTVFNVKEFPNVKARLYAWATNDTPMAWYDSNEYPHQKCSYDAVLAVQSQSDIIATEKLAQAIGTDWLFGFFSYEFAQTWEQVTPTNPRHISAPKLQFFCPKKIWLLKGDTLTALYLNEADAQKDFDQILATQPLVSTESTPIDLVPGISKQEYIKRATALQQHIFRGDIYEINYCMEWFAKAVSVHPAQLFSRLNNIAKTPFAAYFHLNNIHLMCASPERFLMREGTTVMSQPIKGTAARHEDVVLDAAAAQHLKNDAKERAENIMITDLVRNDLSRVAKKGSVAVVEQCAVYPFAQVHQMISTIVAQCDANIPSLAVIDACFPMGSMTGAPKQRAMELIDSYEVSQRGLYSGAVGYFTPHGDFDFNVVIRSLIYDAQNQYLSTHVGSAITAASDVEKEYEECQLKAAAIKGVLTNKRKKPLGHGTKV